MPSDALRCRPGHSVCLPTPSPLIAGADWNSSVPVSVFLPTASALVVVDDEAFPDDAVLWSNPTAGPPRGYMAARLLAPLLRTPGAGASCVQPPGSRSIRRETAYLGAGGRARAHRITNNDSCDYTLRCQLGSPLGSPANRQLGGGGTLATLGAQLEAPAAEPIADADHLARDHRFLSVRDRRAELHGHRLHVGSIGGLAEPRVE